MLYGEIYNEVCENCWPGAAVPTTMPDFIRRKIRACQRMLNRDFDFWFTLASTTISSIADTKQYALPSGFKKIERAYWDIDGQNYCTAPLERIDLLDHVDSGLTETEMSVEYPGRMRVDGENIFVYPAPSEVRTLNVIYWEYLDAVPSVQATFEAYEDDFSIHLCEAIIGYVTSQIKQAQNEWQSAQMFKQDAQREIQSSLMENQDRIKIPEVRYKG